MIDRGRLMFLVNGAKGAREREREREYGGKL